MEAYRFTVHSEGEYDLDGLFERIRPMIVNAFERINPTSTRLQVNFKQDPNGRTYQCIVDHDETVSVDDIITRTVRVLRVKLGRHLGGILHHRFGDWVDWDEDGFLAYQKAFVGIIKGYTVSMGAGVTDVSIKMFNEYRHYHKLYMCNVLHKELLPILVDADRLYRLWCWCDYNDTREARSLDDVY